MPLHRANLPGPGIKVFSDAWNCSCDAEISTRRAMGIGREEILSRLDIEEKSAKRGVNLASFLY
jgi:hypothetical protein